MLRRDDDTSRFSLTDEPETAHTAECEAAFMEFMLGNEETRAEFPDDAAAMVDVTVRVFNQQAAKPVTMPLMTASLSKLTLPEGTYSVLCEGRPITNEHQLLHEFAKKAKPPQVNKQLLVHLIENPRVPVGGMYIDAKEDPYLLDLQRVLLPIMAPMTPEQAKVALASPDGLLVNLHALAEQVTAADALPRNVRVFDTDGKHTAAIRSANVRFPDRRARDELLVPACTESGQVVMVWLPSVHMYVARVPTDADVAANPSLLPWRNVGRVCDDFADMVGLDDYEEHISVSIIRKRTLAGYSQECDWYRFAFSNRTLGNKAAKVLEAAGHTLCMRSNGFINDTAKAMLDADIRIGSWARLRGGDVVPQSLKRTIATLEISNCTIKCEHLVSGPDPPPASPANITSWDYEAQMSPLFREQRGVIRVDGDGNYATMVSTNTFNAQGTCMVNALITYIPCGPLPNAVVIKVQSPLDVVKYRRRLTHLCQTGTVIGFNTDGFDYELEEATIKQACDPRGRRLWFPQCTDVLHSPAMLDIYNEASRAWRQVTWKERSAHFSWSNKSKQLRLQMEARILRTATDNKVTAWNLGILATKARVAPLNHARPLIDNVGLAFVNTVAKQRADDPDIQTMCAQACKYIKGLCQDEINWMTLYNGFPSPADATMYSPYLRPVQFKELKISTQQAGDSLIYYLDFHCMNDIDLLTTSRNMVPVDMDGDGPKGRQGNSLNQVAARLGVAGKHGGMGAQEMFHVGDAAEAAMKSGDIAQVAAVKEKVRALAAYCVHDSMVTAGILFDLSKLSELLLVAWLTRTSVSSVQRNGVTSRFFSLLVGEAWKEFVIEAIHDGWDPEIMIQGAFCLDPTPKFYEAVATCCVDVNSLYPTEAQVLNLCASTLICDRAKAEALAATGVEMIHRQAKDMFPYDKAVGKMIERAGKEKPPRVVTVAQAKRHADAMLPKEWWVVQHDLGKPRTQPLGLLPRVWHLLIDARKAVRRKIPDAAPKEKVLLEIFQSKVLKVLANAGYGAVSCPTFKLPCIVLGAMITHGGRQAVMTMKMAIDEIMVRDFLLAPTQMDEMVRLARGMATPKGETVPKFDITAELFTWHIEEFYKRGFIKAEKKSLGGDTDSVFSIPPIYLKDRNQLEIVLCFAWAQFAVNFMVKHLFNKREAKVGRRIFGIAAEYVSLNTLTCGKKQYGLYMTEHPLVPPRTKQKGVPSVKGDVPTIIRNAFRETVNTLQTVSLKAAVDVVKKYVDDIRGDRVSVRDLCKVVRLKRPETVKNPVAEQYQVLYRFRRLSESGRLGDVQMPAEGRPLPLIRLEDTPEPGEHDTGTDAVKWQHPLLFTKGIFPDSPPIDKAYYLKLLADKLFTIVRNIPEQLDDIYETASMAADQERQTKEARSKTTAAAAAAVMGAVGIMSGTAVQGKKGRNKKIAGRTKALGVGVASNAMAGMGLAVGRTIKKKKAQKPSMKKRRGMIM